METLKSIDHCFQSKMTKKQNLTISTKIQKIQKISTIFRKCQIFPKIFLKTKFNLENLICDGSLSLIGYAAVKCFNAFLVMHEENIKI